MEEVNQTTEAKIIFAWSREKSELQVRLFLIFLSVYLFTVKGILSMVILILLSSQVHTPMYNLLSTLPFIDCCQSTVFTPEMLVNTVTEKKCHPLPRIHSSVLPLLFFYCCRMSHVDC